MELVLERWVFFKGPILPRHNVLPFMFPEEQLSPENNQGHVRSSGPLPSAIHRTVLLLFFLDFLERAVYLAGISLSRSDLCVVNDMTSSSPSGGLL